MVRLSLHRAGKFCHIKGLKIVLLRKLTFLCVDNLTVEKSARKEITHKNNDAKWENCYSLICQWTLLKTKKRQELSPLLCTSSNRHGLLLNVVCKDCVLSANVLYLVCEVIDPFHYDVTHAKVSGSCSKDCPQGRSIAGKFKIIHKNTCNAMAAELVDHVTSIMLTCIIERTSSDISDKPAFTPPGHIKRQQRKSKEALFCKIFDFFLIVSHSVRYKTVLRMASCTLNFQAGNFTCILRMKSFEDISFKSLLLQGTDLKNARRRF